MASMFLLPNLDGVTLEEAKALISPIEGVKLVEVTKTNGVAVLKIDFVADLANSKGQSVSSSRTQVKKLIRKALGNYTYTTWSASYDRRSTHRP